MTAPSAPPPRPFVGIRSPNFSASTQDWVGTTDDDPWDSASDNEGTHSKAIPINRHTSGLRSPKRKDSSSSSNLALSYTHVTAPSPGSYPGKAPDTARVGGNNLNSSMNATVVGTSHGTGSKGGAPNGRDGTTWTIVSSPRPGGSGREDETTEDTFDTTIDELDEPPPSAKRLEQGKEAIKYDVDDLVNDPLHAVRRLSTSDPPMGDASSTQRRHKFIDCLTADNINIAELRKLAWSGIPEELRPISWQLLLGYLPLSASTRTSTLTRKRGEYASLVELTFARGKEGLDQQIWHQIEIDVPRTRPGVRLWMEGGTQRSLERILYVWAIRHPTSGYVQGINDLVTPFFQVFLGGYIDSDPETFDPSHLPAHVLTALEADSFWCLSRLLDGIQDNYINGQPGIVRSVGMLGELAGRIDPPLAAHLKAQHVEFMQFAFRWMNCLLMRELSVRNIVRMWDTYLSEGSNSFSEFHLYVCCAFLKHWKNKLMEMDFQGIIMFLQSLPTQSWGDHDIQVLLAEAFVLSNIWKGAQSHFVSQKTPSGGSSGAGGFTLGR